MTRNDSHLPLESTSPSWVGTARPSAPRPGWTSNNVLSSIWQNSLTRAQARLTGNSSTAIGQVGLSAVGEQETGFANLLSAPSARPAARRVSGTASPAKQSRAMPASLTRRTAASAYPSQTVLASATSGLVPSQFDPSLRPQEANAACGPAAAVAFARASGRNLNMRQAVDMAKGVGWTIAGGMNGVMNQKRLLDKMGVAATLDSSGDWGQVTRNVAAGKPVTISTPGHYFVADAYDEASGRFHVGASGTAYQNGKEWMTRQEIEGVAGKINGALVLNATNRTWQI